MIRGKVGNDQEMGYQKEIPTPKTDEGTSSPRATIAHLRVNKYSHWTKCLFFFSIYGYDGHLGQVSGLWLQWFP